MGRDLRPVVAFPFRLVRLPSSDVSAAAREAAQVEAADRWAALSPSQQYRRQLHRCGLLGIVPRFAGSEPSAVLTKTDQQVIGFARRRFFRELGIVEQVDDTRSASTPGD